MKRFTKYHSLIFSIILFFGFQGIALVYLFVGYLAFLMTCLFFFIIFIIEGFLSLRYAQELSKKLPLPHILDDIKHVHITSHVFLPILLYAGVCAFIFFNSLSFQTEILALVASTTFLAIFQSQRSSMQHEFSFDETLHHIYDAVKIIILFIGTDVIIQASIYWNLSSVTVFILADMLAFMLFLLMIVRKDQFNSLGMLYIFVSSLITGLLTLFLATHMAPLSAALVISVIYYLFIAILHHKINATLTIEILAEYAIIAIIILIALRGMS